jgi:DNA-binding MarR family transcriptional regulator
VYISNNGSTYANDITRKLPGLATYGTVRDNTDMLMDYGLIEKRFSEVGDKRKSKRGRRRLITLTKKGSEVATHLLKIQMMLKR